METNTREGHIFVFDLIRRTIVVSESLLGCGIKIIFQ